MTRWRGEQSRMRDARISIPSIPRRPGPKASTIGISLTENKIAASLFERLTCSVPRPVGNRKTVMLVPFEHLVADDARAFADEIGSARRAAVSLRKTC